MENFDNRTNQFVIAVVLACKGDARAQQDVSNIIGQMMQDKTTQPMSQSLVQIVVGERDRAQLTSGLEGEPFLLINRILDALEN